MDSYTSKGHVEFFLITEPAPHKFITFVHLDPITRYISKVFKESMSSSAFAWKEMYSVQVAALDRQHQELFRMISELNDALSTGQGGALSRPVNFAFV